MFLEKGKPHRILLWILGAIILVLGILLFITPPGIYPDPAWGFRVMRCMQQGAHFNTLVSPSPGNIALNQHDFLSWWSPGQYLLPYLFITLFKFNTGKAVAITITLCSLVGLAGYYRLFKRLGFTAWISAISVAFIASQNYFILPFAFYPGGEVLLFAFTGWFLYGCFGINKITWQAMVFLFIAGILGFICKSSFLWMYAAGVGCIWINLSINQSQIKTWLRNGVLLAIPVIAALGVIYVCYLSKGENPSSATAGWKILPETFSFPLASPLLAGLSVDELVKGLIYHPDGPVFSYGIAVLMLIVLALASLAFIVTILKKIPHKNYALTIVVFYVVANLFFTYLYLKQAAISYEGRHFRIIGLLAIPGIIWLLSKTKVTRIVLAVIWAGFIYWEAMYFVIGYKANQQSAHGSSGLSQGPYDKATLNELVKLDSAHHNDAIFVLTSPDIAAEINNNRVLTLDIESMDKEDFAALKYAGHSRTIYMLMRQDYVKNGVAAGISKSFTSYHQFTIKQLSTEYYLYTASN